MIGSEILIEGAVFEHVIGRGEYGGGDRGDGLLGAAASAQAMERGLEVSIGIEPGPRIGVQKGPFV